MKSRSARLRVLARLAALAEHDARRQLGRANAELHQREVQQAELDSYAEEYARHWLELGRQGVEGHVLGRLTAFRASLDAIRDVQQEAVTLARNGTAEAVRRWHAARNQVRVLDELAARLQAGETRTLERNEQHRIDDLQHASAERHWLA